MIPWRCPLRWTRDIVLPVKAGDWILDKNLIHITAKIIRSPDGREEEPYKDKKVKIV